MRFNEIIGHAKELALLKGAINGKRTAHAYLFAGPDGVGKRQTALAFAAGLNCADYKDDACGSCVECERAGVGAHPNIMEVWPTEKVSDDVYERAVPPEAGLIRIDQIREVQSALRRKIDAGSKAVIVDHADRLMPQAANAFLKTLEEPPDASVIILVTSRPAVLPVTVLSRCQRINFRPLRVETVGAHLIARLGIGPAAAAIARLAGGSIARAEALAADGALERRAGIIDRLSRVPDGDAFEAMRFAEELARMDGLAEALGFIKGWYRDRAVISEGADGLALASQAAPASQAAAGVQAGFDYLWTAYRAVDEAMADVTPPRYMNKQITMEAMMVKIAAL
ncbi:MAG: DNA polymerase III subunit [Deltaproteobacteria bacterium]|nr:DNA polymerase III subunit [Deltaproteobacteria bacterium]